MSSQDIIIDSVGVAIQTGFTIEVITDLQNVSVAKGATFTVQALEYNNQIVVRTPNGTIVIAGRNVKVV